jgi:hypothetical protein
MLKCVDAAFFGCAARGRLKTEEEGRTELDALEFVEPEDLGTNGEIGVTLAAAGAEDLTSAGDAV